MSKTQSTDSEVQRLRASQLQLARLPLAREIRLAISDLLMEEIILLGVK